MHYINVLSYDTEETFVSRALFYLTFVGYFVSYYCRLCYTAKTKENQTSNTISSAKDACWINHDIELYKNAPA